MVKRGGGDWGKCVCPLGGLKLCTVRLVVGVAYRSGDLVDMGVVEIILDSLELVAMGRLVEKC